MFCPNCGARNSEADANCQKCGFSLKEQAGAKFKGTMLMMNNASAMAAELRRSAPPGAANPPGSPPPADPSAGKSLSPEAAKQMRAQLKGTMIGVAPPALGANRPPGGGPVAVPRPSSRPPTAPLGAGPLPRQPGPGQVNAPGVGVNRGGGTIIGTGIAPTGASPRPPAVNPVVPPGAHAMTEALPISVEPFGAPLGASRLAHDEPVAPAFDRTHVSPSMPPAPAAAPPAASPPGTQAMSSFESFPSRDPALSGTLVAGTPYGGPATEMFTNEPHFASEAGKRTGTPAMGVPEVAPPTEPAPGGRYDSVDPGGYTNKPSKAMEITLTVLTCGLYYVYQKFMAKNG